MIYKYELLKMVKNKLYIVGLCVVLILSALMLHAQYSEGYSFQYGDGTEAHYYGADYLRFNREVSADYDGRVVNDDFLLDVQAFSVEFTLDPTAPIIYGTSLSRFYENLYSVPEYIGTLPYSATEIFGEDLPVYYYTENWNCILNAVCNMTLPLLFFAVLCTAGVFCGEYASGAFCVTSVTKHGRGGHARAKLLAVLTAVSAAFCIVMLVTGVMFGAVWGFDNCLTDIRVLPHGAFVSMPAGIPCIALLFVLLLFSYVSVMLAAAAAALLSSVCRNAYAALALSAAAVFLPELCQMDRFPGKFFPNVYLLWPSNLYRVPMNDWFSYECSLPVFVWLVILAAVVPGLGFLSARRYQHHKMK